MEKYAKKLQDIINEQDFCFEPEEIKTVEKALGVLKMYEDANIPAEACAEYRKFEDELIRDGMSLQHVLDLLKAEKEGRLKVRPESLGQCCGQCHHFLREPMKASGICEVRKNKHYPRAGTPLYCCQSKKASSRLGARPSLADPQAQHIFGAMPCTAKAAPQSRHIHFCCRPLAIQATSYHTGFFHRHPRQAPSCSCLYLPHI